MTWFSFVCFFGLIGQSFLLFKPNVVFFSLQFYILAHDPFCIRFLQKTRTDRRHEHACAWNMILAPVIMEAGIFHDLQGELAGCRLKKGWCFNSSPKARKMGSVPVKSSLGRNNDLFLGGRSAFRFFQAFADWMRPPTLGRLTCFTQPSDWNVLPHEIHSHRNTSGKFWPKSWVANGPVNLTHKINYHIMSQFLQEGVKLRLSLPFLCVDVPIYQHYFLKRLLSSIKLLSQLCQKSAACIVGSGFGWALLSVAAALWLLCSRIVSLEIT